MGGFVGVVQPLGTSPDKLYVLIVFWKKSIGWRKERKFIWADPSCISFLLLHNKFTTNLMTLKIPLKYPPISSQICRSEVRYGMAGSCAGSIIRLKSRCCPSWFLIWRFWGRFHLQAYSCWQNSVSCGSINVVPVSLLAVSLGLPSAPRGCPDPLPWDVSIFEPTMLSQMLELQISNFLP